MGTSVWIRNNVCYFQRGNGPVRSFVISNERLRARPLTLEQARILLKSGEYRWVNHGSPWSPPWFGSEVIHLCHKVTESEIREINGSSNPGMGMCWVPSSIEINGMTFSNCVLYVEDDEDGDFTIDLRKGHAIDCPRCMAIWQIYKFYRETCPVWYRFLDRLYGKVFMLRKRRRKNQGVRTV